MLVGIILPVYFAPNAVTISRLEDVRFSQALARKVKEHVCSKPRL